MYVIDNRIILKYWNIKILLTSHFHEISFTACLIKSSSIKSPLLASLSPSHPAVQRNVFPKARISHLLETYTLKPRQGHSRAAVKTCHSRHLWPVSPVWYWHHLLARSLSRWCSLTQDYITQNCCSAFKTKTMNHLRFPYYCHHYLLSKRCWRKIFSPSFCFFFFSKEDPL